MSAPLVPHFALAAALLAMAGASAQIAAPGRLGDERLRVPPGLGPAGPSCLLDVNRDGRPDLLRASGATLDVLVQTDDGRFVAVSALPIGTPAQSISALASGDLDGDGFLDVVVGLIGADPVVLSTASGMLRHMVPSPLPSLGGQFTSPEAIAIGEIDGVPGAGGAGADILIFSTAGNTQVLVGSGPVGNAQFIAVPGSALPIQVRGSHRGSIAADLDGDGDLDLIVAPTAQFTTTLYENVAGTFVQRASVNYPMGAAVVGDFVGGAHADVVLFHADSLPQAPLLLEQSSAWQFQQTPLPWSVAWSRATSADLDGTGYRDVVGLTREGAVEASLALQRPVEVLEAGSRGRIAVADYDLDGDTDIFVGGRLVADNLLLGDGTGRFSDAEWPALRGRAIAGTQLGVLLGRQPHADPDLLVYPLDGARPSRFVNRAGIDFDEAAATPPSAPAFPGLDFTGTTAAVVLSADGRRAAMLDSGRPDGLRIVEHRGGGAPSGIVDVTPSLWRSPVSADWLRSIAAGRFGDPFVSDNDDIVAGDVLGGLHLYRADGPSGEYNEVQTAFPNVPTAGAIDGILCGDWNRDGRLDLCVLRTQGVQIWLGVQVAGSAPSFSISTIASSISSVLAFDGVVDDFDADGHADLMLVTRNDGFAVRAFRGHGNGGFTDVTTAAFATPISAASNVRELVQLGRGRRATLVVNFRSGGVEMMPRSSAGAATWFDGPVPLPRHGSGPVVDLVAGDVDGDRDEDLIVLCAGATPQVLLQHEIQLTSLRTAQIGRSVGLRFHGDPIDVAALFLGFVPFRYEFAPFGLLRLADPLSVAQLAIGPTGVAELSLALPRTLSAIDLKLQVAYIRGSTGDIQLGNAHEVRVTDF